MGIELSNESKNQTVIYIIVVAAITLFITLGGFTSVMNSIANILWLKKAAVNGPDPRLIFPLGICGDDSSLSVAIEQQTPKPASKYLAGLAMLRMGDLANAEQLLKQAMDEGISPYSSPYALGVVYHLRGKDAAQIWQKNSDIIRMQRMGNACELAGNNELASDYYRFVLDNLKSSNINLDREIYREIVLFFAQTTDEESFNRAYQSYISLADSDSLEYYRTLATVWRDHGQPLRALEYYQVVLERTPDDDNAWWNAGRVYQALEDYETAREYYRKADELNPNTPLYYIYIGNTYLFQKQYDKAGEWLEKAIDIDPMNTWPKTSLAQVRIGQKQYDEAFNLVIQAIELKQQDYAYALASDILFQKQNYLSARDYLLKALELNPERINYLYKLVLICEKLKDEACVLDTYQKIDQIELNNKKN